MTVTAEPDNCIRRYERSADAARRSLAASSEINGPGQASQEQSGVA
jgi:hypothetical protein